MHNISHKNQNKAASIMELAVVIAAIAIIMSAVMVARTILDNAKANGIFKEAKTWSDGFQSFADTYGCVPGTCSLNQLNQVFSTSDKSQIHYMCGGNKNASASSLPYWEFPNPSSGITKTSQHFCTLLSLQKFGYFVGQIDPNTSYDQRYAKPDVTAPTSQVVYGMWNFASATNNGSKIPGEIIPTLGKEDSSGVSVLYHYFILRDIATGSAIDMRWPLVDYSNGLQIFPAISSKMANKIDAKFDDGLPGVGRIVGGRAPLVATTNTACHDGTGAAWTASGSYLGGGFTINESHRYSISTDIATNGCIFVMLLRDPIS